jgi:hypothetical protein
MLGRSPPSRTGIQMATLTNILGVPSEKALRASGVPTTKPTLSIEDSAPARKAINTAPTERAFVGCEECKPCARSLLTEAVVPRRRLPANNKSPHTSGSKCCVSICTDPVNTGPRQKNLSVQLPARIPCPSGLSQREGAFRVASWLIHRRPRFRSNEI